MTGGPLLVLLSAVAGVPAADAVPTPVPPPACEKPHVPERLSVAAEDVAYLIKKTRAYGACISAWIDERNRHIQQLQAQVTAEANAANAAIRDLDDLNARVKAVRDQNKQGANP